MSDEYEQIAYEEFAFDQMQQEEASLFWTISDALHSIEFFGLKTWVAALYDSLDKDSRSKLISTIRACEENYK
jgi:hypothetical protein